MIKSKRKSIVFLRKTNKATYKLDSYHTWDYAGESKNLGSKYKSNNARVNEASHSVTKGYKQGLDIVDV